MSMLLNFLKKPYRLSIGYILFSTSLCVSANVLDRASAIELSIEAHDKTELIVSHYPAQGDTLIIWVGSSYNFSERAYQTAHRLAKNNIEIWQIDFSEVLFEPKSSNFIRNLNAQYVTDLIAAAHAQSNKKIVLMSRSYGAIPVMRGASLWQQQNLGAKYLSGVILFSPDFFKAIPELGLTPEYLPITRQTTIPTFILQAKRRGSNWQFPRLLKTLQKSNRHIYFTYMPEVAGIFYKGDNNPLTLKMLNGLPGYIPGVVKLLQSNTDVLLPSVYQQDRTVKYKAMMNNQIKVFHGNKIPSPITLLDSKGNSVVLDNFTGKVTVINFWATWCPPCVEEIPSLNRLREKMKDKPFKLISINYAESSRTIDEFLKQINVEFPVLLDSDGSVSTKWNVVAFPSTFIIGPDGKIHYGINAAIRWDADEVITLINSLY